ncbi:MAG: hypothetical protein PHO12_01585 [Bacteroidales bacterium]|nr:hypothetical protein [Bacteroidales bacterium]MDD4683821.1 hypothetical protein [Bacteroidales bacterium]
MKKIFLLAASLFLVGSLSAQTITDALGFSQMGLNGSSNYISRAGAIGALGGDLTAASYNPAGLGLFNSNELSMSTGYYGSFTDANANGLLSSDNRSNFNLGHIGGLVFFKPNSSDIKGFQFTFTLNRLKSFGNRTIFQRKGLNDSYISHIIDNGYDDAYMRDFYESYAVDIDTVNNVYTSVFQSGKFNQLRSFTESGFINEFSMSFSTNIRNFVYLGATLGIPIGSYHSSGSFMEERLDVMNNTTDRYIYDEVKDIYATGVNLKIGTIIRPVNWFRIGLAIHTPTYYSIEDNLYSDVSYQKTSGGDWDPVTYNLQTPFRFLGSAALVLGDNKTNIAGSLSADYEYADYSNMKYRLSKNIMAESDINTIIKDYFRPTNTLRFGGEVKMGTMAFRAGYCIMDNPYSDNRNDAGASSITAGIGYRTNNYYLDLGYAFTAGKSKFYEYESSSTPQDNNLINLDYTRHIAQLTFGARF